MRQSRKKESAMRRACLWLGMAVLTAGLAAGCGTGQQAGAGSPAVAGSETSGDQNAAAAGTAAAADTAAAAAIAETEEAYPPCDLADGTYPASFKTDSSMFRLNEACDGKAVLTVKEGQMTIHVTLASVHILNLYRGTKEQAAADEAGWIPHTTDTVTYSDGMTEEAFGFDVPVPALDTEFPLALIGTKGNWYDHRVTVSLAE